MRLGWRCCISRQSPRHSMGFHNSGEVYQCRENSFSALKRIRNIVGADKLMVLVDEYDRAPIKLFASLAPKLDRHDIAAALEPVTDPLSGLPATLKSLGARYYVNGIFTAFPLLNRSCIELLLVLILRLISCTVQHRTGPPERGERPPFQSQKKAVLYVGPTLPRRVCVFASILSQAFLNPFSSLSQAFLKHFSSLLNLH